MYKVEDLDAVKIEFEVIEALWSKAYHAKKPNPYDKQAKAVAHKLREIEQDLKCRGVIPYSQHEIVEEILNQRFPKAQSNEIVLYEGEQYKKKFWPLVRSKTGKTVKKWVSSWMLIEKRSLRANLEGKQDDDT